MRRSKDLKYHFSYHNIRKKALLKSFFQDKLIDLYQKIYKKKHGEEFKITNELILNNSKNASQEEDSLVV